MNRFAQTAWMTVMVLAAAAGCLAQQTTQPADPVDPALDKILDRVEARGQTLDSLTAELKEHLYQPLPDENIRLGGSVSYLRLWEKDPNAKPAEAAQEAAGPHAGQRSRVLFRVQYDTRAQAGHVSKKKSIWVFDGRWLHELNESTRMLVHREIVPEGQTLDATRLGSGPFPAPFGQKKKDVLEQFTVKLVPPAEKDPEKTDHIQLIPRPNSDLAKRYATVDLYVSRELDLPIRMVMVNAPQGRQELKHCDVKTVEFSNVKINPKLSEEKDFKLDKPSGFEEGTETLAPSEPPK